MLNVVISIIFLALSTSAKAEQLSVTITCGTLVDTRAIATREITKGSAAAVTLARRTTGCRVGSTLTRVITRIETERYFLMLVERVDTGEHVFAYHVKPRGVL